MNCKSFPECVLDCSICSEYVPENNHVNDELLEYIQSVEADDYLATMECYESNYLQ